MLLPWLEQTLQLLLRKKGTLPTAVTAVPTVPLTTPLRSGAYHAPSSSQEEFSLFTGGYCYWVCVTGSVGFFRTGPYHVCFLVLFFSRYKFDHCVPSDIRNIISGLQKHSQGRARGHSYSLWWFFFSRHWNLSYTKPSMEFSLHGRASRKRSVTKCTLGAQMQCEGANRNMGVLIL